MPAIVQCAKIEGQEVKESGAEGLFFRTVFGKKDGFQMGVSYNDVLPGGNSKSHSHPDEHIVFVVRGKGKLVSGKETFEVASGTAIYLAADEPHCFYNTGTETLVTFGVLGPVD